MKRGASSFRIWRISPSLQTKKRPSSPSESASVADQNAALRRGHLAEHVVERGPHHPGEVGAPRHLPGLGVGEGEQRVVVEHLLEVGHQPELVDRVAVEAAADLVVDPAGGHPLERVDRHLERARRRRCAGGGAAGAAPAGWRGTWARRERRRAAGRGCGRRRPGRPREDLRCRGAAPPRRAPGHGHADRLGDRLGRAGHARRVAPVDGGEVAEQRGEALGRAAVAVARPGSRSRRRRGGGRRRARRSWASRRGRSGPAPRSCRPRRRRAAPPGRP